MWMHLLEWLENSGLGMWVAASDSLWGYPAILTLHTFGMALLVGASAVVDLRLLGFGRDVPLAVLRKVSRPVWIGFTVNASTGALLFVGAATQKGTQKLFAVKLTLILLALLADRRIRRVVLGAPAGFATRERPAGASAAHDTPISTGTRFLAATSLLFWAAAITAGRLMAYIEW
jgi:hypothetical protein